MLGCKTVFQVFDKKLQLAYRYYSTDSLKPLDLSRSLHTYFWKNNLNYYIILLLILHNSTMNESIKPKLHALEEIVKATDQALGVPSLTDTRLITSSDSLSKLIGLTIGVRL